jgi:L-asparaginase II
LDSPSLVEVRRGRHLESLHRGAVAVADRTGRLLYAAGPADLGTFLRSSAKPFQALPLIESGGADALGLTDQEVAVTCGSHSGEPIHVETVRAILAKARLDEQALRCGAHPPIDPASADALVREGRRATAIHNNCSGKHAGMLAACRHREWPVESYFRPDHPLQREIAAILGQCCGTPGGAIAVGTDGCGVPTFRLTLREIARAFAALADPADLPAPRAAAARRITGAMRGYPRLVAGTGRMNTEILSALGDRLFCKTGAEAVFGIGLMGRGLGVAVKVEDGNARGLGAVVVEALSQLGVITAAEAESLTAIHHPVIRNHHGWEVGEMRPVFTLEKVS